MKIDAKIYKSKLVSIRSTISRKTKVDKSTLTYVLGRVSISALSFLLLPILVRILSPRDIGIIAIFVAIQSWLIILVSLNMGAAVTASYGKLTQSELRIFITNSVYITSLLLIASAIFLLISLRVFAFFEHFSPFWIIILCTIVWFQSIYLIAQSVLQIKYLAKKSVWWEAAQLLLVITLSLTITFAMFTLGFDNLWQGRALGIALGLSVSGLVAFKYLISNRYIGKERIDRFYIGKILTFSLPLLPHSLLSATLGTSLLLLGSSILGTEAVGVYSVAFQLASITTMFADSYNKVYFPKMSQMIHSSELSSSQIFGKVRRSCYSILITSSILVAISSVASLFILPPEYQANNIASLVGIMSSAGMLTGIYYCIATIFYVRGKTHLISAASTLSVLLSIACGYYLTNKIGIFGLAATNLIAVALNIACLWYYLKKADGLSLN